MLLLLTIGLVLVATVALVIGFITSALAPIYVSIACSVLAALVLFLFSRLSKREAPVLAGGPAPLPGPTVASAPAPASGVTVLDSQPDDSEITAPVATVEPMPAQAAGGEEEFAPQNVSAPIEADAAIAAGDVRSWPEPEADEADEADEAEAFAEPQRADDLESELAASAPLAAASIGGETDAAPSEPAYAESDGATDSAAAGGDDDEDLIFPIADYDELRVGEIVPLLPELDREELEMVREREEQGRARTGVLRRIEQLLPMAPPPPGEVAGAGALAAGASDGSSVTDAENEPDETSEAPPALDETSLAPEGVATGATADAGESDDSVAEGNQESNDGAGDEPAPVPAVAGAFPIDDYDNRKVTEILPLLNGMTDDELSQVAERERAGKARGTVLSKVEQLRASQPAAPAAPAPAKKAPAKAASGTTKAAAKKAGTAAKTTKSTAKATPAKKATKSTKK